MPLRQRLTAAHLTGGRQIEVADVWPASERAMTECRRRFPTFEFVENLNAKQARPRVRPLLRLDLLSFGSRIERVASRWLTCTYETFSCIQRVQPLMIRTTGSARQSLIVPLLHLLESVFKDVRGFSAQPSPAEELHQELTHLRLLLVEMEETDDPVAFEAMQDCLPAEMADWRMGEAVGERVALAIRPHDSVRLIYNDTDFPPKW